MSAQERKTEFEQDTILRVLEPDQLVGARLTPFGRRTVSGSAKAAMWGLRAYAVLMLLVVIFDVIRLARGGA